jgi:hypothetical protein
MISSKQNHISRIIDFETKEINQYLDGKVTSVDVVTEKECFAFVAYLFLVNNLFEHVNHIVVLPMNITNDNNGSF